MSNKFKNGEHFIMSVTDAIKMTAPCVSFIGRFMELSQTELICKNPLTASTPPVLIPAKIFLAHV